MCQAHRCRLDRGAKMFGAARKDHKPDGQGENGCRPSAQRLGRGTEQAAHLFGIQDQAECGDGTKPDAERD